MLDEPRYRLVRRTVWLTLCWPCLWGCGEGEKPHDVPAHPDMLRVRKGEIFDGHGELALLSAVDFINGVDFFEGALGGPAPEADHAAVDFERVRQMGMNTVLFDMSHHWFEDGDAPFRSREQAFEFIDMNLKWAADHGVRLILALSEYPGGEFVEHCGKPELFADSKHQDRVAALWQLLAERYRDDPNIAGYDLLAHPSPNESLDQWTDLANRLVGVVRAVDPHHLIFVREASVIACNYAVPITERYPTVTDVNLVYLAYFDGPYEYTAQLLPSSGLRDGGKYPDDAVLAVDWGHTAWVAWSSDSRPSALALRLPAGDSDWREQRFAYTVTDSDFDFGELAFRSARNSSDGARGVAYFDDFSVTEYDEDEELLRTVFDVDMESSQGFYLYEGDDADRQVDATGEVGTSPEHHRGDASVTLSNTTTDASLTNHYTFPMKLGHTYEVSAWVKADNLDPGSETAVKLDFYSCDIEIEFRTRDMLRRRLREYEDVAQERGLPLFIEFGIGRPAFEDNKGGLVWVEDVLDFMVERSGHLSYTGYHDSEFGIYGGSGDLPQASDLNQPLADLFAEKLRESNRAR